MRWIDIINKEMTKLQIDIEKMTEMGGMMRMIKVIVSDLEVFTELVLY